MKKNIIFIIILVCSVCVMLFSIFNIIFLYLDSNKTKKTAEKLEEIANVRVIKDSNFLSVNFDELSKNNDEVVAWLQVLDTDVNYPIVKHNNNSYYLNHSYDKSWNSSGWPFLDYRNDINDLVSNNIMYGHGRVDGTMFGSLRNLLNLDNGKHSINVSTPYNNYIFEIFSIYLISGTNDYLSTGFENNDEFFKFYELIKNRSIIKYNEMNIESTDKILTLTTCYNNWQKLVVHAKLISWEKRY
jgi:sortase B